MLIIRYYLIKYKFAELSAPSINSDIIFIYLCIPPRSLPLGWFSLVVPQLWLSQWWEWTYTVVNKDPSIMALDTGMKCIKYLLFIFNLLFVVSIAFLKLSEEAEGWSRGFVYIGPSLCLDMWASRLRQTFASRGSFSFVIILPLNSIHLFSLCWLTRIYRKSVEVFIDMFSRKGTMRHEYTMRSDSAQDVKVNIVVCQVSPIS